MPYEDTCVPLSTHMEHSIWLQRYFYMPYEKALGFAPRKYMPYEISTHMLHMCPHTACTSTAIC